MQKAPRLRFPQTVTKGHASVKIYRVENRGKEMFTVSYRSPAGRQRRMFADYETARREANNIAAHLAGGDLEALKLTGRERQLYVAANEAIRETGLTLDVVAREFAEAFRVLGRDGILEAARYYRKHAESNLPLVTVAEAVTRFAEAKAAECKSDLYLKDIRVMLTNGLAKHFQCNLASIAAEDLRGYLNAKKACGPVAKNNHRRVIVALFNFAKAQGWLASESGTAADALGTYTEKGKPPEVYTPAELAKLLEHADAEFLPYVALLAFGGIRREELHKGLTWEAINFTAGTILVPAAIAKTGKKRKIDMPENLRAWLAPYAGKTGPIFAIDPRKRMAALSKAAGVPWKRNALRHSFGGYRMEDKKNAGQVSLEMGNSSAVVLAHYFEIVDAAAAVTYWSLRPAEEAANIVPVDAKHRAAA